jgi:RND family efflux transporter MFP subunit
MKRVHWQAAIVTLLAATVEPASAAAQPFGCLIEPERVTEVGSQVIGVIHTIPVERGDRVRAGQVIAVLRADVEQAAVAVAESRAQHDADVRAAEANAAFTRQQLARAEELFRTRILSPQEFEQARTEADIAAHRLAEAKERLALAQRELVLARTQLAERTIKSPIDGVIAERYLSSGERVEEKPLVRIAKIDSLRVQVVVPIAWYGTIRAGRSVTVVPELPGAAAARARVTVVDKVIDAASNTFRVQLELPNPNLSLPAGLRCKADFGPAPAPAEPPGRTEPRAKDLEKGRT